MKRAKTDIQEWHHIHEENEEPVHYRECGLDNVYLLSGYDIVETAYGKGLRIKNLEALHRAIGEHLACAKKELTGKELRFLRRQMDLTQADLGSYVGLSAQQVARWEKGQSEISGAAELLVRILYLATIHKSRLNVERVLNRLKSLDAEPRDLPRYFEETKNGWKPALAA